MPIDLLCAVCFDANEANRNAFLFMTLFMSLAPLTLIGGGVWYLRKRALEIAAEESGLLP